MSETTGSRISHADKCGKTPMDEPLMTTREEKNDADPSLWRTPQGAEQVRTGNHYGAGLEVAIEQGALVIRIGAQTLAHAVSYSEWANPYEDAAGDYFRTFAITDAAAFADDVRHAMLSEREDGSTPLSDFLDKMTEAAVEDGSMACEYDQRIKHGETAKSETWSLSPTPSQGGATHE